MKPSLSACHRDAIIGCGSSDSRGIGRIGRIGSIGRRIGYLCLRGAPPRGVIGAIAGCRAVRRNAIATSGSVGVLIRFGRQGLASASFAGIQRTVVHRQRIGRCFFRASVGECTHGRQGQARRQGYRQDATKQLLLGYVFFHCCSHLAFHSRWTEEDANVIVGIGVAQYTPTRRFFNKTSLLGNETCR